jgi:hypothetical protein
MEQIVSEKHFHGKPCGKCGETLRYTATGTKCVACTHRRLKADYAKKAPEGAYRKPWEGEEVSETRFLGKPCKVCGECLRYKSGAKACVKCHNRRQAERYAKGVDKTYYRDWNRRWAAANPELAKSKRERSKLVKYGLTPDCYQQLLVAQGGCCAICRRSDCPSGRKLAVDHCHKTGKVRGLLCTPCNTAIGKLNEDPAVILRAAEYVSSHIKPEEDKDAA